jgi:RNA polymerase sigma-70 factor (ECF subfamily)
MLTMSADVPLTAFSAQSRGEERPLDTNPPSEEEAALVRDTQAGDVRSFEAIVHLHSRRVFHFIFQMTRQRQDAEDLTQQTFIKAYRNIHRFEPGRPLINWLLTIARRTALNHFRSWKAWEQVPDNTASSGPSPAQQVTEQERAHDLWERARRVLARREFEVLWLRFSEELSTEETARVMGLTKTHIKVLVFRARRQLSKGEQIS